MPIYLVRWPDLSAALVKASSEEKLELILDEVANPEGCTWSVYRGPLFIELALPARFHVDDEARRRPEPLRPEDVTIDGVDALAEGVPLEVSLPPSDTAAEMCQAIERKAFPHVFGARHEPGEPDREELRKAVAAELQVLLQASWTREQVLRRDDVDARVAADLGAPLSLVRKWREAAHLPPGPPPRRGKRQRSR
jgi:hypothetical protein